MDKRAHRTLSVIGYCLMAAIVIVCVLVLVLVRSCRPQREIAPAVSPAQTETVLRQAARTDSVMAREKTRKSSKKEKTKKQRNPRRHLDDPVPAGF